MASPFVLPERLYPTTLIPGWILSKKREKKNISTSKTNAIVIAGIFRLMLAMNLSVFMVFKLLIHIE